jgi:hypothetical protein
MKKKKPVINQGYLSAKLCDGFSNPEEMKTSSPSASAAPAEQTVEGSIGRRLNGKVDPFNPIGDFPAKNSD